MPIVTLKKHDFKVVYLPFSCSSSKRFLQNANLESLQNNSAEETIWKHVPMSVNICKALFVTIHNRQTFTPTINTSFPYSRPSCQRTSGKY